MAYEDYHKQGSLKDFLWGLCSQDKVNYLLRIFFKKGKEKQRINYSSLCRKMFLKSISLTTTLSVGSHCLTMHSFTTVLCQVWA